MNVQDSREIIEYLQQKDVQARLQKLMQEARSKATVTISRAANLFNFSESQLREWEKRGLLKTDRPLLTQDGKTSSGHRQFSPDELDKLALIRELMDQNYTISEIPHNIDVIWKQILTEHQNQALSTASYEIKQVHEVEHIPIEERIGRTIKEVFWRYFVSQVLRLSLMLLCEDMQDTKAGLIIPLQQKEALKKNYLPGDQPKVGPSLVGWLNKNRSFYSFLDADPSFEFPSDFRIQPFPVIGEGKRQDNVLIVIQRAAKALSLNSSLVEIVRRLLDLLYQHVEQWQPCFDFGMRDWEYQVTDFTNPNAFDEVLNNLADMVVELGGKTPDGQDRWHYSLLFLPRDPDLPIQQRHLVVRAQSQCSPHQVGVTSVHMKDPGLSFRAYQSGHVIYRPKIAPQDIILAYRDLEETTRSAIAIPIAGDYGLSIAVLYIASKEMDAFSIADQRVLRLITRMLEELLVTYHARLRVTGRIGEWITNPGVVDPSFKEFLSENDFINDVEVLLTEIHLQDLMEIQSEEVVSFIAIDIDNQSSLATKYGDQVARNLSREVGLRIRGQLLSNPGLSRLYHVNADRYYLLLKGMPLEEARSRAETLRVALGGEYRLDARRVAVGRPMLPAGLLEIPKVTVRLGVQSYQYRRLKEVLQRYPAEVAVAGVRALVMQGTNEALEIGQREGGNCIISWDPNPIIWSYRRWSPSEDN